jgi:hypothetical protein
MFLKGPVHDIIQTGVCEKSYKFIMHFTYQLQAPKNVGVLLFGQTGMFKNIQSLKINKTVK